MTLSRLGAGRSKKADRCSLHCTLGQFHYKSYLHYPLSREKGLHVLHIYFLALISQFFSASRISHQPGDHLPQHLRPLCTLWRLHVCHRLPATHTGALLGVGKHLWQRRLLLCRSSSTVHTQARHRRHLIPPINLL